MESKVTEYSLMLFFVFVSMVVLYLIYMGLINTQRFVQNQVNEEEYKVECNCFQVLGLSNKEITIRNILCEYVDHLAISWPDYEYSYNETILKNQMLSIVHNSSFKDQFIFHYNNCE